MFSPSPLTRCALVARMSLAGVRRACISLNHMEVQLMATMESPLEEPLQEELKDLYDAEKQLTKALPKQGCRTSFRKAPR